MADTLQSFNIFKRAGSSIPTPGDPIDVAHGWTALATVDSATRQYPNSDPAAAWFGMTQTTVNGAVIPYPVVQFTGGGTTNTPGKFGWFRQSTGGLGTGETVFVFGVATDSQGRITITGWFRGTMTVPGGPTWVCDSGSQQMFIVSYDSAGTLQWANRIGRIPGRCIGYGVAIDSGDNIVVTGTLSTPGDGDQVDFGNGQIISALGLDRQNAFVAKFNSAGVCQWAKNFTSSGANTAYSVATRASNGIIVVGWCTAAIDFGGGNRTLDGGTQGFVLALDASGAWVWDREFPVVSVGASAFRSVTVDSAGAIVASGTYSGVVNFGGGARTSALPEDNLGIASGFIVKLTAGGVYVWDRAYGTTTPTACFSVATDPITNDVIATGLYVTGTDFGNGPTPVDSATQEGQAFFVVRYGQATGSFIWLKHWGGAVNTQDIGWAVTVSSVGNIYVTGGVQSAINFGGGWNFGNGLHTHFVLALTSAGAWRWDQRSDRNGTIVGSGNGLGIALIGGVNPRVVSGGWFKIEEDWGGGVVTTPNGSQAYGLATYSQ